MILLGLSGSGTAAGSRQEVERKKTSGWGGFSGTVFSPVSEMCSDYNLLLSDYQLLKCALNM